MNIVVAEDQEMTRSLVVSRLKEWGHAVTDFEDGKAAFQYLICNHDLVDILITDWNMPGLNGVQLAHSVR